MTTSRFASLSSKKKKFYSTNITLITKSKSHKYSKSFQNILYQIGITILDNKGIIFLEHEYIELPKYFLKANNLPLFLGYIIS